ncbi:type I secretion protein [Oricola cellulosilytica]|uniref:Type I secretion protein n=1 Tax=Oricola cellulosilytica TaxID=1429082 RepID=A0A4R0PAX9_9HYPH|nr:type I secretion protein [Oricola cellulosilytica]TCD14196.1 type I secretion protein [Oricola cellulosilytica]
MVRDWITEAIAHFVGIFETIVEAARSREAYDEFRAAKAAQAKNAELKQSRPDTEAEIKQKDFDPDVEHRPVPPELRDVVFINQVAFETPDPMMSRGLDIAFPGYLPNLPPVFSSGKFLPPQFEPVGSYAVVINQMNRLSDNDIFSIGGSGLVFNPDSTADEELDSLVAQAGALAPLSDLPMPETATDIPQIIHQAGKTLSEFVEEHGDDHNVDAVSGSVIVGTFVNGELVETAPKLEDYRRIDDDEDEPVDVDEDHPLSELYQKITGSHLIHRVDLEAGGNTAINEAVILNNWLKAPVIVGMGDSFEINAIIQINVWWDQDLVADQFASWEMFKTGSTSAFNIAKFLREDPLSDKSDDSSEDLSEIFPKYWSISKVEGDLVFMNWIQQYNFIRDNDSALLASSGVKASVMAGGNTQINATSVAELGFYYDLIIVGGSIYDAAFIQQMNVLLDKDLVGGVDGFHTSGHGTASTSGNLLWNEAHIFNIGGAGRFESLPDHFRTAAEGLANGSMNLPGGVFEDSMFAGLENLRVLYVKGSIYDLQLIKQTNIVGDSDQVALAMNQVLGDGVADWYISTGSNELINLASIYDVDASGKTYLSGAHYSQEILIQAEIISSDPDLGGQDPNVLINEAVAFLDDQVGGSDQEGNDAPIGGAAPNDASHQDVMQTMLA